MKRIAFIHNPKAGRRTDLGMLDEIRSLSPAEWIIQFIPITDLNDFDAEHCDILVAIGGDGTVKSVAEYCLQHKCTLAVIPRGSGDGTARHHGMPYDLQESLEMIAKGNTLQIDTVEINGAFFLNVAGTGFEGHIAHAFSKAKRRGLISYANMVRKHFRSYPRQQVQMTIDGKTLNFPFFSLSIANGSQWGNDFKIASEANMRDGLLEIAVMQRPKWYEAFALFKSIKSDIQQDDKHLQYFKAKEISVLSSENLWHLDGEPEHYDQGVTIKVNPLSLTIIAVS